MYIDSLILPGYAIDHQNLVPQALKIPLPSSSTMIPEL